MMKKVLTRVLNFMASMNLAIFILAGVALLITIQSAGGKLTAALEGVPVLQTLTAKDLYHSQGFAFLLVLFCCNLLACNLKRVPKTIQILKSTAKELDDDRAGLLPCVEKVRMQDPAHARQAAYSAVEAHFKKPSVVRNQVDRTCLFAEKGRYSHFGFYFAHLNILIVVLGVMLSTLGYRHSFTISKGQLMDPVVVRDAQGKKHNLPFALLCEDHKLVYYPGTSQVKKHESIFSIVEGDRKVRTQRVDFAHSMRYRGYEIFQERFTGKISFARISILSPARGRRTVEVKSGAEFSPEGSPAVFWAERITPDFIRLRNSVTKEAIRVMQRPVGFSHQALRQYQFSLEGVTSRGATRIKVVKDPGRMVIWVAMIGMLAGFAVVFFWPHQQLWLSIGAGQEGCVITLAGSTTKNPQALAETVQTIKNSMQEDPAPAHGGRPTQTGS